MPHGRALAFSIGGVPVRAVGSYEGLLRTAVVRMKDGERAYLDAFAVLIADRFAFASPLVPLPTTPQRRAARGFDQSVAIAERVARACDVPMLSLLRKSGSAQHGRRREARLLGPAFRVVDGPLPPRVTLLDDVCTTGGTIRAAVAALAAAGVRVDGTIVVARTPETRPRGERS